VRVQITADDFPHVHPQLCVFLYVSGRESVTGSLEVAIVRASDDEVILRSLAQEVVTGGPLVLLPLFFRLQDCEFPEAGLYYVQVFTPEKLVHERPLLVAERTVSRNGQTG